MRTIMIKKQTRDFYSTGKNAVITSEEWVWECPCGEKDKTRTVDDAILRAKYHSRTYHRGEYSVHAIHEGFTGV